MDLTAIQAGLSSLKTAFDITKGLIDLGTATEINGKIIELQRVIIAAQTAQEEMAGEIKRLKDRIAHMQEWSAEKERYKKIAPWDGIIVYALKESMSQGDPPHWICPKCYEDGKASLITLRGNASGEGLYICACGHTVPSGQVGVFKLQYAPG